MFSCMKTTVDLPDELLIRAKKRAAETRTPLRVLIERGLRRELASFSAGRRARRIPRKIKWVVAPGGLPPGLDVSDRASLHDWIRSQR
jgi:hypothetical protein